MGHRVQNSTGLGVLLWAPDMLAEHAPGKQDAIQSWACCTGISTYHVGYKATVAPPAPLVIITGPHDFDTSQVAKSAKLFLQNLLIHIR